MANDGFAGSVRLSTALDLSDIQDKLSRLQKEAEKLGWCTR